MIGATQADVLEALADLGPRDLEELREDLGRNYRSVERAIQRLLPQRAVRDVGCTYTGLVGRPCTRWAITQHGRDLLAEAE